MTAAKGPAQKVLKKSAETRTSAAATKTSTKPSLTARRTSSPALAYSPPSSYHNPNDLSLLEMREARTC